MVSIYSIEKNTLVDPAVLKVELRGLSTDVKPTSLNNGNIANGSVFIEIDTADVYLYDGENKEWFLVVEPEEVVPADDSREIPQEDDMRKNEQSENSIEEIDLER